MRALCLNVRLRPGMPEQRAVSAPDRQVIPGENRRALFLLPHYYSMCSRERNKNHLKLCTNFKVCFCAYNRECTPEAGFFACIQWPFPGAPGIEPGISREIGEAMSVPVLPGEPPAPRAHTEERAYLSPGKPAGSPAFRAVSPGLCHGPDAAFCRAAETAPEGGCHLCRSSLPICRGAELPRVRYGK